MFATTFFRASLVGLGVAACSVFAVPVVAQEDQAQPRQVRQPSRVAQIAKPAPDVPVFRPSRVSRRPIVATPRVGGAEHEDSWREALSANPEPPDPLDESVKAGLLKPKNGGAQAAGQVKAQPEIELTSVRLTARKPFWANQAVLHLSHTWRTDGETGVVFIPVKAKSNHNYAGAILDLNVVGGERYLCDCEVANPSDGEYVVTVDPGGIENGFVLTPGSHHILFMIEPQSDGWIEARLGLRGSNDNLPDTWFALFGCEITRLE
jgi:hypothetical protein